MRRLNRTKAVASESARWCATWRADQPPSGPGRSSSCSVIPARASSTAAYPPGYRPRSSVRSMRLGFLAAGWSVDQGGVEVVEGCGGVIGHPAVGRSGLNRRAARRGEPVEALRQAHAGKRAAGNVAGRDALDQLQLRSERVEVGIGPEGRQSIGVQGGARVQVLQRAAEEDEAGVH